jgi:endonuclease YncB( thermonuclease family)
MSALADATADVPKFGLAGQTLDAKLVTCHDGDSFYAVLPLGGQLWKFECRMYGYDSPEMNPAMANLNREDEKAAALKAKHALLSYATDSVILTNKYTNAELNTAVKHNRKVVQLRCREFDKYGRLLVDVIAGDGPCVNDLMISGGYGYKYAGGTKKPYITIPPFI